MASSGAIWIWLPIVGHFHRRKEGIKLEWFICWRNGSCRCSSHSQDCIESKFCGSLLSISKIEKIYDHEITIALFLTLSKGRKGCCSSEIEERFNLWRKWKEEGRHHILEDFSQEFYHSFLLFFFCFDIYD